MELVWQKFPVGASNFALSVSFNFDVVLIKKNNKLNFKVTRRRASNSVTSWTIAFESNWNLSSRPNFHLNHILRALKFTQQYLITVYLITVNAYMTTSIFRFLFCKVFGPIFDASEASTCSNVTRPYDVTIIILFIFRYYRKR